MRFLRNRIPPGRREKAAESQTMMSLAETSVARNERRPLLPSQAVVRNELLRVQPMAMQIEKVPGNFRDDWRTYQGNVLAPGLWIMAVYRFGRWRYGIRPRWIRMGFSFAYKILFAMVQIASGAEFPARLVSAAGFGSTIRTGLSLAGTLGSATKSSCGTALPLACAIPGKGFAGDWKPCGYWSGREDPGYHPCGR